MQNIKIYQNEKPLTVLVFYAVWILSSESDFNILQW
jgi:hypothetical protein